MTRPIIATLIYKLLPVNVQSFIWNIKRFIIIIYLSQGEYF